MPLCRYAALPPTCQMEVMAEVAAFCRERQELCHRAEPVPQIALVYDGSAFYRECLKPFGSWDAEALKPLRGILAMLLESQCVVEICMAHHLKGRCGEYPLIVVPEWRTLEEGLLQELSKYVSQGGSLLVVGPEAASLFASELDIRLEGDTDGETRRWLEHDGRMCVLLCRFQRAALGPRARGFGELFAQNDFYPASGDAEGQTAAVISRHGKGMVAAVLFGMGVTYLRSSTGVCRRFLKALVDELFPAPLVRVTGSSFVDVTLMRASGSLCVHLVNTAGAHANADVYVYDEIPPIGPLTVRIRAWAKPRSVTLAPGGRSVAWSWVSGEVVVTVGRLEIHEVLVIHQ